MNKALTVTVVMIGALAALVLTQTMSTGDPTESAALEATVASHWQEIIGHTIGGPVGNGTRYTAVEFGDFECPQCSMTQSTIDRLVSTNGDAASVAKSKDPCRTNVSLYFVNRPFPSMHVHSIEAGEAAEAAAHRHQFWAMRKALYHHGRHLSSSGYGLIANSAGLDGDGIQRDVTDGRYTADVIASEKLCDRLGITITPMLAILDRKTDHVTVLAGKNQVAALVNKILSL